MKPIEFLETLLFGSTDFNKTSLQDLSIDLNVNHKSNVTKQAIHKKFNEKSVDFLKKTLDLIMQTKLSKALDKTNNFSEIRLGDSTKFKIHSSLINDYPGFGGNLPKVSLMNIQYAYNLKNGNFHSLEIKKATDNDQSYVQEVIKDIPTKSLFIYDQGYITTDYLQQIIRNKAYFLNRLPAKWNVVRNNQEQSTIDWQKMYTDLSQNKDGCIELPVLVSNKKIPCRLIVSLIPQNEYEKRIRKSQKCNKKSPLSQQFKSRARFNVYITNCEADIVKCQDVRSYYSLRWQIELIFKTWKSIGNLCITKKMNKYRLETQLIARLIWVLLTQKMLTRLNYTQQKEEIERWISVYKGTKAILAINYVYRQFIFRKITSKRWYYDYLAQLVHLIYIEPKNNKTPHYQILKSLG